MQYSRDLDLLFPPFAVIVRDFESRLRAAGLPFYLFMGIRTWEEQDALYQQGRATPGDKVTNAPAGMSWHNYGLGCDYVLDGMIEKPGIQWSWETKNMDLNKDGRNDWLQMAEIAVSCGLDSGYYWKKFPDLPHIEKRYGLKINEARELYLQGGLPAVWDACEEAA